MNYNIPTPEFDAECAKALEANLIESATLDWYEVDDDGGIKIKWTLEIFQWTEHIRPMTESGRREIAAEAAAVDRLIEAAKRDGFLIAEFPEGIGKNDRGSYGVEWEVQPPETNQKQKMKPKISSARLRASLEIVAAGGAVMASEWTSGGTPRHISKRAIPPFCEEVEAWEVLELKITGKGGIAARKLLREHPRCRKIVLVSDWPALMRATKEIRASIEAKHVADKALWEKVESDRVAKIEEAKAIAANVAPATIAEWGRKPHADRHPAPPEIYAAKMASGLGWASFESMAENIK